MTLSSTPGQKPGASIPLRREEAMLPLTEQRNHSCVLRREQLECPLFNKENPNSSNTLL